jgi:L-aminopeptidase/D-esterase-like protein
MKRREFLTLSALLTQSSVLGTQSFPQPSGSITDVEGVKIGHFTETKRPTGCTVILTEEGAVGGVDQRGGAPGTRETDLLNPVNHVEKVNAVVLSGGSAFGLATADGVMRYLEEKGFGYQAGRIRVPIVPAAILFDLGVGDSSIRPTAESGYKACQAAGATAPEQGNVGAGAGATVGKMLGPGRGMKGGFGTASVRLPNGLVVGAVVATNGVGDVWNHISGKLVVGARTADGKHLADVMALMRKGELPSMQPRATNTTIGAVATNAELTKVQATKMAQMASDGFAMSIRPVHTPGDGDTIFSLSTCRMKMSIDNRWLGIIGALAADVMAQAIVSAVLHAKSIPGFAAVADLEK